MNRISTTARRNHRLQAAGAAALVALTALVGAAWLIHSAPTEPVAVLERVVVEGKRAEVQQLPRVVVTGRRDAYTSRGSHMPSVAPNTPTAVAALSSTRVSASTRA